MNWLPYSKGPVGQGPGIWMWSLLDSDHTGDLLWISLPLEGTRRLGQAQEAGTVGKSQTWSDSQCRLWTSRPHFIAKQPSLSRTHVSWRHGDLCLHPSRGYREKTQSILANFRACSVTIHVPDLDLTFRMSFVRHFLGQECLSTDDHTEQAKFQLNAHVQFSTKTIMLPPILNLVTIIIYLLEHPGTSGPTPNLPTPKPSNPQKKRKTSPKPPNTPRSLVVW